MTETELTTLVEDASKAAGLRILGEWVESLAGLLQDELHRPVKRVDVIETLILLFNEAKASRQRLEGYALPAGFVDQDCDGLG